MVDNEIRDSTRFGGGGGSRSARSWGATRTRGNIKSRGGRIKGTKKEDDENQENHKIKGGSVGSRGPIMEDYTTRTRGTARARGDQQDNMIMGDKENQGEYQIKGSSRIQGTKKFMGNHENQEEYQIKGNHENQGNHKIKGNQ